MEHNTGNDYSNVNRDKFIHSNIKSYLNMQLTKKVLSSSGQKSYCKHTIARIIITPWKLSSLSKSLLTISKIMC